MNAHGTADSKMAYELATAARHEAEDMHTAARRRFEQIDSPTHRSTRPLLPDGTAVTDLGLAAAKEALGIAETMLAAAREAETAAMRAHYEPAL